MTSQMSGTMWLPSAVTARLGGGSLGTKMQQRAVGFKGQKGSMKVRPQLQRRCRAALRIWG